MRVLQTKVLLEGFSESSCIQEPARGPEVGGGQSMNGIEDVDSDYYSALLLRRLPNNLNGMM
jgi:hypothetical protein